MNFTVPFNEKIQVRKVTSYFSRVKIRTQTDKYVFQN